MKLSKKKLQELKDNKLSIEDLEARYFINSKDENALKLLNENIENENIENMLKLLNESICSFQQIVDKFKSIQTAWNAPSLFLLLKDEDFFKRLIENNILTQEDLRYLLNKVNREFELYNLSRNTILLTHIISSSAVSFKKLIDKFKSIKDDKNVSCLWKLLGNEKLFEELIQNNKLTIDDLKYLLNKINESHELIRLCDNTPLIKHILNEFVLNTETVDRFSILIENDEECKKENIHTIFDLTEHFIEYFHKNNEEIDKEVLKLNELNKHMHNFDLNEDQRLELIELTQNNEVVKNRLIRIIENNLESNFDFESLMMYLKKEEKKSLFNI